MGSETYTALSFEGLEDRLLLSTVTVDYSALTNELTVTGDGSSNDVVITTNDQGQVVISGENGTTIDESSPFITDNGDGTYTVTEPVDDLTIDMGGGDDSVTVEDLNLSGNLSITTDNGGNGFDTVVLTNVSTDGTLDISTGGGNDFVSIEDSTFVGNGTVNMGAGDDELDAFNNAFRGQTNSVQMGRGDDLLDSGSNDFFSTVTVVAGGLGNDTGTEEPDDTYHRLEPIVIGFEAYYT